MDKFWKRILNVSTVEDFNRLIEAGELDEAILVSESVVDKKIVEITNRIIESRKRLILIAGPSSSGKTSFAKKIRIQLRAASRRPVYVGTDDYFLDRAKVQLLPDGKPDFESIEAVNTQQFSRDLSDLLAGKEVDAPVYDFLTGLSIPGQRHLKVDPGQPIIVEGLHSLNDALTPSVDESEKFRIYIRPMSQLDDADGNMLNPDDLRKMRRIVRDSETRGWTPEQTLEMWDTITDGEKKYIEPYKDKADIVYDSSLPYELAVLKKFCCEKLAAVPPESPCYEEARRLLAILETSAEAPTTDIISADSIIREFIGGSLLVGK